MSATDTPPHALSALCRLSERHGPPADKLCFVLLFRHREGRGECRRPTQPTLPPFPSRRGGSRWVGALRGPKGPPRCAVNSRDRKSWGGSLPQRSRSGWLKPGLSVPELSLPTSIGSGGGPPHRGQTPVATHIHRPLCPTINENDTRLAKGTETDEPIHQAL